MEIVAPKTFGCDLCGSPSVKRPDRWSIVTSVLRAVRFQIGFMAGTSGAGSRRRWLAGQRMVITHIREPIRPTAKLWVRRLPRTRPLDASAGVGPRWHRS
jgi:hypothetical protein